MVQLELRDVTKRFGGIIALKEFSMALTRHEVLGLIGPNGAGKTTVFNLVTGFYQPTSGEIRVAGRSIAGLDPARIVGVGVARTFQNIRLFNRLSVLENVTAALHREAAYSIVDALMYSKKMRQQEVEITEKAVNLLDMVGLKSRAVERADSLPYGLQRKLELARALALSPSILLLDEPAAGMNPEEARELVEMVKHLHERFRLTTIIIDHHMEVVMSLCSRILVLNFGSLLAEGTPAEVQSNPAVLAAYLGEDERAC